MSDDVQLTNCDVKKIQIYNLSSKPMFTVEMHLYFMNLFPSCDLETINFDVVY